MGWLDWSGRPPASEIRDTLQMNDPVVSIGVPVFNGANYLAEALESLLAQTFADFEILVSDNGSTDATPEIARGFAARDPRVRYERLESNIGAAANHNRVFGRTRGRYFKFASHDDIHLPNYIERTLAALDADPGAVLAYGRTRIIGEDGQPLKDDIFSGRHTAGSASAARRFYDVAYVQHQCFQIFGLMRREAARRSGMFLPIMSADRVLLGRMALLGRLIEVPEVLFLNRYHPAMSRKLMKRRYEYSLWFDPANAGRVPRTTWTLYLQHWRSVLSARLGCLDALGCLGVLLRWPWARARWRQLLLEILSPRRAAGC